MMTRKNPIVVVLGKFDKELLQALNKEGVKIRLFEDFENFDDIDGDILLVDKDMDEKAIQVLKIKPLVPVAFKENKYFVNFEPNYEHGFAFLYNHDTPYSQFAAVIRAMESYKFPYDWKNLQLELGEVLKRIKM